VTISALFYFRDYHKSDIIIMVQLFEESKLN